MPLATRDIFKDGLGGKGFQAGLTLSKGIGGSGAGWIGLDIETEVDPFRDVVVPGVVTATRVLPFTAVDLTASGRAFGANALET